MAQANFLQPARASLVEEWVEVIREEFPESAQGVDIAKLALQYSIANPDLTTTIVGSARIEQAYWPVSKRDKRDEVFHHAKRTGFFRGSGVDTD